ncbi:SDR family NAD(P)-dependent oxidoreductase [Dyadobacter flavalbus]|uniref:SDR family NAD(P)-dependent oxidoreductase n=1 Tax=Dyadobacter flavalbus TaxID=2579942 RepID=A0A5M8QW10_9BACT|nr:SDR family NAD(P)-dependent oxidoreductase [Dyadobacter flavalbus]KAA6438984.1 SDR family NAD(P)-dependent oxidoreductase [Dyadobacter flavalbus]
MIVTGNTILITGGTSGIGLAFAEEFIKEGNRVIITGRREDRLEAIKNKLPEIITRVSDVSDAAQRAGLAEWVFQNYPETNMLINNAGIQLVTDLKSPVDLERVRTETETNFIAPVHLASLFTPHFAEKENAAIINITSGLAFAPLAFMPVYCATKAAMHSLTLSLRHQLKQTGIKVFEIAPPAVDTELGHDRREDKSQSHGGIPVQEFIAGAMKAIKNDELEAAIGQAAGLRSKREALFEQMNSW